MAQGRGSWDSPVPQQGRRSQDVVTHGWDSALLMAEAPPWGEHTPDMQESLLGSQSSADPILAPPESTAGCPASRDMSGEHSDPLIPNLSQGLCAAACTCTHLFLCVHYSVSHFRCSTFSFFVTQTRATASHEHCVLHRTQAVVSGSLSNTTLWHSNSQAKFTWTQNWEQDGGIGLHFGAQSGFSLCHSKQAF